MNGLIDTGEHVFGQFGKSLRRVFEGVQKGGNALVTNFVRGINEEDEEKRRTIQEAILGII